MRNLVLLCRELETLGHGLDLDGVLRWLTETMPDVEVRLASDLAPHFGAIQALASTVEQAGTARLTLGLCSEEYETPRLQAQVRKVGLDPLGVQVVNLGALAARVHPRPQATEKARLLLAAAMARAATYPGSRPQSLKPYLATRTGRRSLFTLSLLAYRAVPFIHEEQCAADAGCALCSQACPCGALPNTRGRIHLDKSPCQSCGLCAAACPRGAVEFPGPALSQVAAQVATLLDPALTLLHPRRLLFVCPRNARALDRLARRGFAYSASWLPVEVPCLAMLPPIWPLACLALGAAEAALAACPGPCPLDQQAIIEGRLDYGRAVLSRLGQSADRLRSMRVLDLSREETAPTPSDVPFPATRREWDGGLPLTPRSAAGLLAHLARGSEADAEFPLSHPFSPFGLVRVAADCTACGSCAHACPTSALFLHQDEGEASLTFDAAVCVACGQCLPACPEAGRDVLRMQPMTDSSRLAQGRIVLHRDQTRRCRSCGAPIASETLLRQMATTLGQSEAAPALRIITQYCPACRGWPA